MSGSLHFDKLFVLIGERLEDCLTPILDGRITSDSVTLIADTRYAAPARRLQGVFAERGRQVHCEMIASFWDACSVASALQLLFPSDGKAAMILIGETSPATLFAAEAAHQRKWPIACVDPWRDRLIWHADGSSLPDIPLRDSLTLHTFMAAHGLKIEKGSRKPTIFGAWLDFARSLLQDQADTRQAMPALVKRVNQADVAGWLPKTPIQTGAPLDRLVHQLVAAGCLENDEGRLRLPTPAARIFLAGGWLEQAVLAEVLGLRSVMPLQDAMMGTIVSDNNGVSNEFDVAFLADNHLYLIECKARSIASEREAGLEALYKIASVRHLGGLHASGLLVTLHELPPGARTRAASFGIELVSGNGLAEIRQHLQNTVGRKI